MEIQGNLAILNPREQRVFGCEPEIFVSKLQCGETLDALQLQANLLNYSQEFANEALRERRLGARAKIAQDLDAAIIVSGMVLAFEVEEYLAEQHTLAQLKRRDAEL